MNALAESPELNRAHLMKPSSRRLNSIPKEFKIVAMRECGDEASYCENPMLAVAYWRANVEQHPYFNPDVECMVVLLLNTRKRITGHHLVATGLLDTVLCHPREVFRAAAIGAAAGILLMHNHPSGDPSPSAGDINATHILIKAGKILQIEVVDHVIIGRRTPERVKDFVIARAGLLFPAGGPLTPITSSVILKPHDTQLCLPRN